MAISSAEYAAIALRVNSIIMRAQLRDDEGVARNWGALLDFLDRLR